jgi:hypothetical protein
MQRGTLCHKERAFSTNTRRDQPEICKNKLLNFFCNCSTFLCLSLVDHDQKKKLSNLFLPFQITKYRFGEAAFKTAAEGSEDAAYLEHRRRRPR